MSDVAEKLAEARKLIERGWTQGAFARGKRRRVKVSSPSARCWCAMGALFAVDYHNVMPMTRPLKKAVGVADTNDIFDWNDAPERTQAEVLAAFDKAIELARGGHA